MTNEQKAVVYGQLLNEHTKLQNEISQIKSETGGDLKPDQKQKVKLLEMRQVRLMNDINRLLS